MLRWRRVRIGPIGPILRQLWQTGGLVLIITVSVGGVQHFGGLRAAEWFALDLAFNLRPPEAGPSRVVLVTLDEVDLSTLKQWPLSDATLATILQKVKQQQPRVIGLDLYRNLSVAPGQAQLQQIFASTPNLIGVQKVQDQQGAAVAPPLGLPLSQVAASDMLLDRDGKVRRALISLRPPRPMAAPTCYSLGAKLALVYLAAEQIAPQHDATQPLQVILGKGHFTALRPQMGFYEPDDLGGYQILSNFHRLQGGVPQVSLRDVLADRVPVGLLRDKIVLIGTQAESLHDAFATPYSRSAQNLWSGTALHADVASQLVAAALKGRQELQLLPIGGHWALILGAACLGNYLGVGRRWCAQRLRWVIVQNLIALSGFGLLAYGGFLSGWWISVIAPGLALTSTSLIARSGRTWDELQRSYRALAEYSKTLEAKVEERTQALSSQNLALEAANSAIAAASFAKSEFLANLNHELRTPLAIILSSSELLAYDTNLQTDQKDQLATIDSSVQHLLGVINNVLELSRLEAGAAGLNLSSVSLPRLLGGLEDLFRLSAMAKGLRFQFDYDADLPNRLYSDESKLRQVLVNLLSNAIKFTDRGTVTLRVQLGQNLPQNLHPNLSLLQPDTLRFEVEDTGFGIDPSEQGLLFVPFVQTTSGRRSGQGTGLGLSISQQFIKLMGGEITVVSQLGQGSRFSFEIPRQIAPKPI
jgi:adenylate cyclase